MTDKKSVVALLADKYGMEAAALEAVLCETIFPTGKPASRAQVAALCIVATQYDLNPITKEIYAFPTKGGGIQPIIAVDGWYKILNGQAQNNGFTVRVDRDEKGKPRSATSTFWRKDREVPFEWTEELDEVYRDTEPWRKTTTRMLKHRALCQGARVCYGINAADPDEAERIPEFDVVDSKPVTARRSIGELAAGLGAAPLASPRSGLDEYVESQRAAEPAKPPTEPQDRTDDAPWSGPDGEEIAQPAATPEADAQDALLDAAHKTAGPLDTWWTGASGLDGPSGKKSWQELSETNVRAHRDALAKAAELGVDQYKSTGAISYTSWARAVVTARL